MPKRFDYKGYHGCESHCFIEIFSHEEYVLVIATEAHDNKGTSITNAAEHIATSVCQAYEIDVSCLVWIEHYQHPPDEETFDLVAFKQEKAPIYYTMWEYPKGLKVLTKPRWKRLSVSQKDRLVKGDSSVIAEIDIPPEDKSPVRMMWSG